MSCKNEKIIKIGNENDTNCFITRHLNRKKHMAWVGLFTHVALASVSQSKEQKCCHRPHQPSLAANWAEKIEHKRPGVTTLSGKDRPSKRPSNSIQLNPTGAVPWRDARGVAQTDAHLKLSGVLPLIITLMINGRR